VAAEGAGAVRRAGTTGQSMLVVLLLATESASAEHLRVLLARLAQQLRNPRVNELRTC